jgi:pyridoxamine 5'-phosphate oxidase
MDFEHPPKDPIAQLNRWIEDARAAGLPNPNAMSLATVDGDGRLSSRIVLLKAIDERGAVFFTNRTSCKGLALRDNPHAALLFHWDVLNRQVRIEGSVSLTDDAESDAYFATRPRESRIGAWASKQSQAAKNRAELDAAVAEIEKRFAGKDVPRPPHWGGYRVSLDLMEFWSAHPFRLHDRVIYMPVASGSWKTQRLFP